MLVGGIKPHLYCLPVLKRKIHQQELVKIAISGHKKFFLGTDSAPHEIHLKESKFCNSCNRIISEGITQGGYILPDSRYICNLCHQSSVVYST